MTAKEAIEKVRQESLLYIRNFLMCRGIDKLDFEDIQTSTLRPTINNKYTLTEISFIKGSLFFFGLNSSNERTFFTSIEISLEDLAGIYDWLNDDSVICDINEYLEKTHTDYDEKDFTFRFTEKTCVDITVSASSFGEAEVLANEKFRTGDYDSRNKKTEITCKYI